MHIGFGIGIVAVVWIDQKLKAPLRCGGLLRRWLPDILLLRGRHAARAKLQGIVKRLELAAARLQ